MNYEYRLVQVVLSHIGDDRITVGLFYWDGEKMRVGMNIPRFPRAALRQSVVAIRESLKQDIKMALKIRGPGKLADLMPVRIGAGSAFPFWTHVFRGDTGNLASHFEELRQHFEFKEIKENPNTR